MCACLCVSGSAWTCVHTCVFSYVACYTCKSQGTTIRADLLFPRKFWEWNSWYLVSRLFTQWAFLSALLDDNFQISFLQLLDSRSATDSRQLLMWAEILSTEKICFLKEGDWLIFCCNKSIYFKWGYYNWPLSMHTETIHDQENTEFKLYESNTWSLQQCYTILLLHFWTRKKIIRLPGLL